MYLPFRNDLYLTLERGEFERGGKSTGKNIEVCVMVVRDEGRVLEVRVVRVSQCSVKARLPTGTLAVRARSVGLTVVPFV